MLPFTGNEVIKNLSSYVLSQQEEDIMKYGLKHGIPPARVAKSDIFETFELLSAFLTTNLKESQFRNPLYTELSQIAQSYASSYKPTKNTLAKHGILKKLRKNKDIIILRPDKGNGIVILNRVDYDNKIFEILGETGKFREIEEVVGVNRKDVTMYRESKLQRYLCHLKKYIPQEVYENIYPTGSVPSRLYGLPKVHKITGNLTVPPLRPIVSSIGAYNYKLAKYLSEILQPLVPKTHSASDTFSFVSELSNVDLQNKFLVSFDVVSLFTNIPLEESINLAVDKIFETNASELSKTHLKKLFLIATSQTHFYLTVNIMTR